MYQLGAKPVELGLPKLQMVVAETVTCSLTVFAEDFQPEVWTSLIQAPAKVILGRLGDMQAHVMAVWGRSFRKDRDRALPADANTVQIWVSVPASHLCDLLRPSGFSCVYVTPRDAAGGIDAKYPVFWIADATHVSMETACSEDRDQIMQSGLSQPTRRSFTPKCAREKNGMSQST